MEDKIIFVIDDFGNCSRCYYDLCSEECYRKEECKAGRKGHYEIKKEGVKDDRKITDN